MVQAVHRKRAWAAGAAIHWRGCARPLTCSWRLRRTRQHARSSSRRDKRRSPITCRAGSSVAPLDPDSRRLFHLLPPAAAHRCCLRRVSLLSPNASRTRDGRDTLKQYWLLLAGLEMPARTARGMRTRPLQHQPCKNPKLQPLTSTVTHALETEHGKHPARRVIPFPNQHRRPGCLSSSTGNAYPHYRLPISVVDCVDEVVGVV